MYYQTPTISGGFDFSVSFYILLSLHSADSKYLGNVYFGNETGKNNINGSWYNFSTKEGYAGYLSVTATGKKNECVPLTETVWGFAKDGKSFSDRERERERERAL